jgi:hypothetical protein
VDRRKKKDKRVKDSTPESIAFDLSKRKIDFNDAKKSPVSTNVNKETLNKKTYKEAVKQQYVVETSSNVVNKSKESSPIDNTRSFLSSGVEGEKIDAKLHSKSSKECMPRQFTLKVHKTIYSTKKVEPEIKINKSTAADSAVHSKLGHICLDKVDLK